MMGGTSSKAVTDSDVLSCLMLFTFFPLLRPLTKFRPVTKLAQFFFLSEHIVSFTSSDHVPHFAFSIACTASADSLKECCVDLSLFLI